MRIRESGLQRLSDQREVVSLNHLQVGSKRVENSSDGWKRREKSEGTENTGVESEDKTPVNW